MNSLFPHRRDLLNAGLSGLLGLTTAQFVRLRQASAGTLSGHDGASKRKSSQVNSCVFLFLFGGPSHIDLWDMKPQAPAEIRGEFRPIATRVPDLHVCEHLPRLAQITNKLCFLRSMTHDMNVHGPACSEIYTGRPYFGPPVTDQATPQDWPSLASLVSRFGAGAGMLPSSVILPAYSHFVGQTKRIAGQTGGRMGEQFDPLLIEGNP
ncbi:MAG: DUF1501 domain-containing protein, partial [Planctomycetaceae bacterium]|nr:DUF1501 domain-containing protein [Planctomycetaceae bacterium]